MSDLRVLHLGSDSEFEELRQALSSIIDDDWTGVASWGARRSGAALRRPGRSICIAQWESNQGLTTLEIVWRVGREVRGRFTTPVDPSLTGDCDNPIDSNEAVLAMARAIARAAIPMVSAPALIGFDDPRYPGGDEGCIGDEIRMHLELTAATAIQSGIDASSLRAAMPSPWASTHVILLDHSAIDPTGDPDAQAVLAASEAAFGQILEATTPEKRAEGTFNIHLETMRLRLPDITPIDAMRSIGRVAA